MFLSVVALRGSRRSQDSGLCRGRQGLAIPGEAKFFAPLAFLGGSYPPEFPLLLVCQLALGGNGFLLDGLLAGFANAGFGVASVSRHGEDENVVEGTAYCPRVRGNVLGRR